MSDRPVFARVYERFSAREEGRGQAENRARALSGLRGRVVEVGAGNGLNFVHYPPEVTEVVAVEPLPYLRERASERAAAATVSVRVVEGTAEALPLADGTMDAAVVSLVLCSVADQAVALTELRRALRAGGELRFYEHVVSRRPVKAAVQRVLTRTVWSRIAGGCHLDRDTGAAIEAAGFVVEEVDRVPYQGLAHLLGVARAPGG